MFPTLSRFSYRLLLASFLLGGGSGCGDDPVERPSIVWSGEHVQVGTDLDLDAWCPGTLPLLDRHVGLLKEMFDAPADHVVTYYLYPPPVTAHAAHACPEPLRACFTPEGVFTTDLLDLHEIVHGVQRAHGGLPHIFSEGGASYWGGTVDADFRGLDIREVLDKLWSGGLGDRGYALAAHFTSYLIHTSGMEPYVALMRATSRNQSRKEFEQSFAHAMGMTLDDAIFDYEEQWPYCDAWATQYWFHSCAQPALVLPPGEDTQFDLDISCANPVVAGPSSLVSRDGVPRIWHDITIDLDRTAQFVLFDVPGPDEPNTVQVEVKPCNTDCGEAMFSTWSLHPGTGFNAYSFDVVPGRHVVRVSRAADDPGPVRFRWDP